MAGHNNECEKQCYHEAGSLTRLIGKGVSQLITLEPPIPELP